MDTIVDNSNQFQSNINCIYSSIGFSNQQSNQVPIQNTIDGEVIDVFIEDRIYTPIVYKESAVVKTNLSNNPSTTDQVMAYIKINGRVIKGENRWRITDENNNQCFETGHLDNQHNRSGFSYVYLNGELREIHEYRNDRRVGDYKVFLNDELYEYNDKNQLLYEGDYSVSLFDNYYRSGYGKEYKEGKLYFEGEWDNNYPNGEGILYNDDGSVCKEGEWNNGYQREENGYYNYATKDYLNGGCVKFLILLNFLIGLILLLLFMIFSFEFQFVMSLIYGLLFIFLAISQQFYNTCSNIISFVIVIALIISIVIFIIYIYDDLLILWVYFCFYLLFDYFLMIYCRHNKPYPSFYNILFPFIYKKEWKIYLVELIITILPFIQYCLSYFIIFDDDCVPYCWFMMIDFVMYLIIFYLHCCDNCLFKVGIVLGYIWGVLSVILCIGCIYLLNINEQYRSWFIILVTHYVIMILYTWLCIVISYYLKQSQNHAELPITQVD